MDRHEISSTVIQKRVTGTQVRCWSDESPCKQRYTALCRKVPSGSSKFSYKRSLAAYVVVTPGVQVQFRSPDHGQNARASHCDDVRVFLYPAPPRASRTRLAALSFRSRSRPASRSTPGPALAQDAPPAARPLARTPNARTARAPRASAMPCVHTRALCLCGAGRAQIKHAKLTAMMCSFNTRGLDRSVRAHAGCASPAHGAASARAVAVVSSHLYLAVPSKDAAGVARPSGR
jgi:hypothetical protein